MIRGQGMRVLGGVVVLSVVLTGCGSSGGADADAGKKVATTSALCAKDVGSHTVAIPPAFPAGFPFPAETKIYAASDEGSSGTVVTGVTVTPFATVLASLQKQLPAKGFTPKDGESEPHDAESNWTSSTFDGRWAIREIPQCPGETLVNVVARRK